MSNKNIDNFFLNLIEKKPDWEDENWKYIMLLNTKVYLKDWKLIAIALSIFLFIIFMYLFVFTHIDLITKNKKVLVEKISYFLNEIQWK